MASFQRVVFPTDFSKTAESALKSAVAFAAKHDAELHIVSVVDSSAFMYAGYPYADLTADLVNGATKKLQAMKLPATAKKLKVIPVVLEGDIGTEVAAYAAKVRADVIVMASHARGSVSRFFLGSVADRLLHNAKCPMLLMRAPDGTAKAPLRRDRGFKKILVPTDFSVSSDVGLGRAMSLAEDYGAEVHILHIVDAEPLGFLPKKDQVEAIDHVDEIAQKKLDQLASWDKSGLKIKTAVGHGDPADAVAKYAATNKCDLIVMGSHGRNEFSRLVLGSVADRILRLVECPVFVERSGKAAKSKKKKSKEKGKPKSKDKKKRKK